MPKISSAIIPPKAEVESKVILEPRQAAYQEQNHCAPGYVRWIIKDKNNKLFPLLSEEEVNMIFRKTCRSNLGVRIPGPLRPQATHVLEIPFKITPDEVRRFIRDLEYEIEKLPRGYK